MRKQTYGKLRNEDKSPELDDCSENTKKALIGLNFLYMLFGLTLVGLAIYLFVSLGNVKSLLSMGLPIAMLVLGTFICMLSCFGCCGAIKRSKALLIMYLALLLLLILGQFLAAWFGYSQSSDLENKLYNEWQDVSDHDKNALQDEFNCCGFYNSTDYPGSNCVNTTTSDDDPPGCVDQIKDTVKQYFKVIIIIGSIFAAVELVGLLTSCMFLCCYESYEKYASDEEDMEQFLNRLEKY